MTQQVNEDFYNSYYAACVHKLITVHRPHDA